MNATVHLPGMLAAVCGGRNDVPARGATVDAVLTDLMRQFPLLRRHIYADSGELRGYVNIFRGEEDVRHLDGIQTSVRDGDVILIVPSVAGGVNDTTEGTR